MRFVLRSLAVVSLMLVAEMPSVAFAAPDISTNGESNERRVSGEASERKATRKSPAKSATKSATKNGAKVAAATRRTDDARTDKGSDDKRNDDKRSDEAKKKDAKPDARSDAKPLGNATNADTLETEKPTRTRPRKTDIVTKDKSALVKRATAARKTKIANVNYTLTNPVGERVLVEVHIGRFASKSVLAFEQNDGQLLVPVMPILHLAGVSVRIENERLEGRQSKTGPRFSFDIRSKELRHGDDAWFVPSRDVARNNEGLWVSVPFLTRLMGADASYDQQSADLEVREGELFPVGIRALRDASILAQRAKLAEAKKSLEPVISADSEVYSLRNRAVVMDYQFTHNMQPQGVLASKSAANSDFESAIGASFPLLGGVMNTRVSTYSSFNAVAGSGWWTLTRAPHHFFSELSVGEVRTRGFQSRELRGFSITNGDPVPDIFAGQTEYALRLPTNWQLDAFRGSNLISSSLRADGEHTLPVSLSYGTNTIDFIAHGPDGQERIFQRSFHTPSMYVTPGEVDYAVAGGLCKETTICLGRMNADVRYGLMSNLVVRAGVDGRLGSVKRSSIVPTAISTSALIPYFGMSAVLNRSTVIDGSIQPSLGSSARSDGAIQVRYEPNPNLIVSTDVSSVSSPIYQSPVVQSQVDSTTTSQREFGDWMRSNRVAGYVHYAPSFAKDRASLEAWTSVQSWNTARASSSRIGLSAQAKSVQFRPYIRWDARRSATTGNNSIAALDDELAEANNTKHTSFQGIEATYVPPFRMASTLGEWWVRGSFETSQQKVDNWSASLTRAFGRFRVDAAMLKRSGIAGRSWTLSVVSELPQMQISNFSASATTNSRASTITQVQGSAIYDGELRHVMLSAEPATGRAGVAGVVFLDENGDGIKQNSEKPIPGVQLYVNNKSLVSDNRGGFLAWGLPGYTVQQILVDTSSLADPTLIPMQAQSLVKTIAGTLVTADIPVVVAGTLHGSIRTFISVIDTTVKDSAVKDSSANDSTSKVKASADSIETVYSHPVQLVLVNVRTGVRRLVDTFSDGTFYEEGLAPGEYLVSVDAASLIGSGLASSPVSTHVAAGRPSTGGAASSQIGAKSDADLVLWLRAAKRER